MEASIDPVLAANTLRQFLSLPLDDSEEVFKPFLQLPGAVKCCGKHPLERFVYVPGKRKDRVVLIAHTDTVWDRNYRNPVSRSALAEKNGWLCSEASTAGIGADDRSGCAALWMLRDSGHSLLLLDGEEHRHWGARYLARSHRRLLRELNQHCYLVQLDLPGNGECSFRGVPVTKRFRCFITGQGYRLTQFKGGTDVRFLTRGRCGVNVSIGFFGQHTSGERILTQDWYENLVKLWKTIQPEQNKYVWSFPAFVKLRVSGFFRKGKHGVKKLWKRFVKKK